LRNVGNTVKYLIVGNSMSQMYGEMRDKAVNEANKAITALRDALAEQALQKLSDFHQSIEQVPTIADLDSDVGEKPTKEELADVLVPWYDRVDSTNALAEQEPIYISESCAERGCACHYSVEVDGEPVAVYSTPVRTKDLTDDEIREMFNGYVAPETLLMFRAVIAADREKNK